MPSAIHGSIPEVDVVIAGAGLVGASMALALAPTGLDILVIEAGTSPEIAKLPRKVGYDGRVSALSLASEALLKSLSVWPQIKAKRACPYTRMYVWDRLGTAAIEFDSGDLHRSHLGTIVENEITVAALSDAVSRCDNVQVKTQTRIQQIDEPASSGSNKGSNRNLILSDDSEVQSRLVIGADGALSRTRSMADIPLWEWDYEHTAIVATVNHDLHHQHTAWQIFTPWGPLAFLPLEDQAAKASNQQHFSSIVWSLRPERAVELMAASPESFGRELTQAFESKLGEVVLASERLHFPLKQRHAQTYVKEGLALIGDAAHSIHPLAGQGVNLGLSDVAALSSVVAEAMNRGEPIGGLRMLRRYQRQRQAENMRMASLMEILKRLYGNTSPWAGVLRNSGIRAVNSIAPLKNLFASTAMGLDKVDHSPL